MNLKIYFYLKRIILKLVSPFIIEFRHFRRSREKHLFKVNRLGIFCSFFLLCILFGLTAVFLFVQTPLKQLLPGYLTTSGREQVIEMRMTLDSLLIQNQKRTLYLQNLQTLMQGASIVDTIPQMDSVLILPLDSLPEASERERAFAADFEDREKYNLSQLQPFGVASDERFIAPVQGVISAQSLAQDHPRQIEILCANEALVISPLKGVVLAINESFASGYEIIIQHSNGYVSKFSQLASPLCQEGTVVSQGGLVGRMAGEKDPVLKTNLLYELWFQAKARNPLDYIKF